MILRGSRSLAALLCLGLSACGRGVAETEEPTAAKRARLEEEKRRLEGELRGLAHSQLEIPAELKEDTSVVVGVPSSLVRDVIARTLTDGLDGLTLRVNGLKLEVEDELKARLLLVRPTLGDFRLDVVLEDVRGRIEVGTPKVTLGKSRVGVAARVDVLEGRGGAKLRFRWNSHGVANVVCGDVDVTREVKGRLEKHSLQLGGTVALRLERGRFVVDPDVPPIRFRLELEPSKEAWATLERLFDDQSDACRFALRRLDAVGKLRELLEKGIEVTVHTEELDTVHLPLELNLTIPLEEDDGGDQLELTAAPAALKLDGPRLWFGIDVSARRASSPR